MYKIITKTQNETYYTQYNVPLFSFNTLSMTIVVGNTGYVVSVAVAELGASELAVGCARIE